MVTFVSATILTMTIIASHNNSNTISISNSSIEMGTMAGCHKAGKKWKNTEIIIPGIKTTKHYECIQEVIKR